MPVPNSFRAQRDAANAARDPVADAVQTAQAMLPAGYTVVRDAGRVAFFAPGAEPVNLAAPDDWRPVYVLHDPSPRRIVDAALCAIGHRDRTRAALLRASVADDVRRVEEAWLTAPADDPLTCALVDAWHVTAHEAHGAPSLAWLLDMARRRASVFARSRHMDDTARCAAWCHVAETLQWIPGATC